MNKTTKGALAATSAAALLMGGVGTLAFWSDDATVNGGSVNSGYLFIDPAGATPCDATWTYANGSKAGVVVKNIVPGDQITKTCRFVVGAQGDNLEASPTVPTTVGIKAAPEAGVTNPGSAKDFSATVDATYVVSKAGSPVSSGTAVTAASKLTEANDTDILTAKFVVTFPYGDAVKNGNTTQNITATLDALNVSLTQDKAAGNPNA